MGTLSTSAAHAIQRLEDDKADNLFSPLNRSNSLPRVLTGYESTTEVLTRWSIGSWQVEVMSQTNDEPLLALAE